MLLSIANAIFLNKTSWFVISIQLKYHWASFASIASIKIDVLGKVNGWRYMLTINWDVSIRKRSKLSLHYS